MSTGGVLPSLSLGILMPRKQHRSWCHWNRVRTLPHKTQQLLGFRSFHNRSHGGGSLWQHNFVELAEHNSGLDEPAEPMNGVT